MNRGWCAGYAGAVFTCTGAVAPHLAVRDGADALVPPIIMTGLAAASWVLRPPARRELAPSWPAHAEADAGRHFFVAFRHSCRQTPDGISWPGF